MSRLKQSFCFLGKVGQTAFIGFGGIIVIGSLGLVIVSPILLSETCQVYYLKKNMSEFVSSAKSTEEGKKYCISRVSEVDLLDSKICTKVTPEKWTFLVNPSGRGQSWLVKEWAASKNKEEKIRGPMLYTDMRGVGSVDDVKKKLLKTIDPFFLNLSLLKPLKSFEISTEDKLRYFRLASERFKDDGRVVVWIFDSINCLVEQGSANQRADVNSALAFLFEMSKYLIPLPVGSDLNNVREQLYKINRHIAIRTCEYHPVFMDTSEQRQELLKEQISRELSEVVTDELIRDAVQFIGGKLSYYNYLVNKACSTSFIAALSEIKDIHRSTVNKALHLDKHPSHMSATEVRESLARYELLCRIANGEVFTSFSSSQEGVDLLAPLPNQGELLLFWEGGLTAKLVIPGTAEIVLSESVTEKMTQVHDRHSIILMDSKVVELKLHEELLDLEQRAQERAQAKDSHTHHSQQNCAPQ